MAIHIGRRKFIGVLGGAAVAWPLAALAQQAGKLPTIGFLGAATALAASQRVAAFVQRLRELGWIEVAPLRSSIAGQRDATNATPKSRLSSCGLRSMSY